MSRSTTINLTRPITTDTPAGALLPWEAPYRTEDIVTLTVNGANLFHITMGSGSATRLLGPGLGAPDGATTDQIAPERLVNRDATVVRVDPGPASSAGSAGAIEPDELRAAFAAAAPLRGDAILLVTGWGDTDRWRDDPSYYLATPHLTESSAETLVGLLAETGSDLLLTDCAYLDSPAGSQARSEWTDLVPWLRPPFPSDAARTYLEHYRRDRVRRDWAATLALTAQIWTVVGLVGCGGLRADRVRLTIAPLNVQGVGEVPCTVIAQERDDGAPARTFPR
ncbi:cyclase family protein [Micromonospora sp. NBC_01813]|uniref:cyclase family protein n=1 Tax=Micromonospora sp. NBC_01813 TaxID=2975988 RepID=UPI002DDB9F97|nr:cyclase family protein [Micromonospora sp. NBC_01813]WSA07265.1 cyclase family protein [Micromonospora sp. NBC_01813]